MSLSLVAAGVLTSSQGPTNSGWHGLVGGSHRSWRAVGPENARLYVFPCAPRHWGSRDFVPLNGVHVTLSPLTLAWKSAVLCHFLGTTAKQPLNSGDTGHPHGCQLLLPRDVFCRVTHHVKSQAHLPVTSGSSGHTHTPDKQPREASSQPGMEDCVLFAGTLRVTAVRWGQVTSSEPGPGAVLLL